MDKYYKIVTDRSPFAEIYNMNGIIQKGTQVVNPYNFFEPGFYYWLGPEYLHFSQGAFDTMLWHNILFRYDSLWFQIYEIVPLSQVYKNRCLDNNGFFQCGAEKIEIRSLIDIDDIYKGALQEYCDNPDEKIKMYPNLQMAQVIDACKHYTHFFPRILPWEQEALRLQYAQNR